jgi:hypothetical protein
MNNREITLIRDSSNKLDLLLLTLSFLANEEPITSIENEKEHLEFINNHFERLRALETLFSEPLDVINLVVSSLQGSSNANS